MRNSLRFLMLYTSLWLVLSVALYGQIAKEGTPASFKYAINEPKEVTDFTPNFDWVKIAEQDAEGQKMGKPLRVGVSVPVDIDINSAGQWLQLPDGKMMWSIRLKSAGATALGVVFSEFELPQDAELYLYNANKSMVIGAFGSHNNNSDKVLSTSILAGDEVIIEYIEKHAFVNQKQGKLQEENGLNYKVNISNIDTKAYKTSAKLRIGELSYMDTDAFSILENSKPDTDASAACEVNINCTPVGDSWQNAKRGVAHIVFKDTDNQWYVCTGSLVNTAIQNGEPYFLTAEHCGGGASDALRAQWVFYFNYERPGCANTGTPVTTQTVNGATLKAKGGIAGGSDFQLLYLSSDVPLSYNPFYNGWDRSTTATASGASIHHPAGDVKKISTFSTTPGTTTWSGGMASAHWNVTWSSNANGWGVTEGGSSGSPLFSSNNRIIGTLTGGGSYCTAQSTADQYGKIDKHWEANGTAASQQLKPWLDPLGSNPSSVEGWDPTWVSTAPTANFLANATSVVAGTEITFTDLSSNGPTQWLWNFGANAFPQTSTERNPKVTWVTDGTYNVSLTATNSFGSSTVTKTNYVTVTAYSPPTTNPITIGTGTSVAGFPISSGVRWAMSSSLYLASEINGNGIIDQLAWYCNTARGNRPISIYMKHTSETAITQNTFANMINGATLVYQGTISNLASAWKTIDLTTAFNYNGISNLLVMASVDVNTQNASAGITYSTSTNRHQEWAGAVGGPSTTNGTVNSNRPNIRMRFKTFTAPVADFVANVPTIIMEQGFDGTWLPDGWTVVNTHATNRWQQGNPSANPYTNIDPNNVASAIVPYIAANQDEWLISPQINTAAYTGRPMKIKFHAGFSRSWLSPGATMSFKISTNNGGTWTQLWNAVGDATEPTGNDWAWRLIDIDLASYAGQNVKFAWQYVGNDGDLMGLDGVKLYLNEFPSSFNIFEGETLSFLDKSTNNPTVWNWQFPGTTTPTVNSKNPTVQYNVAGTYNVVLTAGNPAGTNTKSKTGYVIVSGRAPIANFNGVGNLKTATYQPFVPVGGSVLYTDLSTRVPTSWSWSFSGGNPPSSTAQNPTLVTYNAAGLYSSSLTATNATGSNSKVVADFVKVGGTAFATNTYSTDAPVVYTEDNGFIPGHSRFVDGTSTYSTYQWADYYSNTAAGQITKVQVYVRYAQGVGKNVIITVWDGSTGQPGAVLGSKTVAITTFTEQALNTVNFDAAINVTGSFFVGYQLTYDGTHNFTTHQFCPYTSRNRDGISTAWVKIGTTTANAAWYDLNGLYGLNTSIWIESEFTYTYTGPTLYSLTLQATPVAGGTVTDNTNTGPYESGAIVSLSANANANYVFVNWKNGETVVSTNRNYSYTMPAANTTLTAHFAKIGDANYDGLVNVIDIVWIVNSIVNTPPVGFLAVAADVNGDVTVDATDVVALVNIILSGAKAGEASVISTPGYLTLQNDGIVRFESDGTLAALQFQLNVSNANEVNLSLIAEGYQLAYGVEGNTITGIIYSPNNKVFDNGEIPLFSVNSASMNEISWGDVFASNIAVEKVEVYANAPTSITDLFSNGLNVSVYPNPTTGLFTTRINMYNAAYVEVHLIDILGRPVVQSEKTFVDKGIYEYNFDSRSQIKSGAYIVRVLGYNADGSSIVHKHEVKLMVINK